MDRSERKRVLRLISNGMYVLTSGQGEHSTGATITWLTQSSFDPPLLVAAIRPGSAIWESLGQGRAGILHMLGDDQQEIAKAFFARATVDAEADPPRINDFAYAPAGAGPRLLEARAWAEVRVREIIDCGGDHELFVLEVTGVGGDADVEPLTVRDSPWEYGG